MRTACIWGKCTSNRHHMQNARRNTCPKLAVVVTIRTDRNNPSRPSCSISFNFLTCVCVSHLIAPLLTSASLTVSALRKALELRGVAQGSSGSHLFPCSRPRVFNPAATVAERKRGAGSGVPDEANFFSQGDDSQEGLDKDLVEELRERRDLYKVT